METSETFFAASGLAAVHTGTRIDETVLDDVLGLGRAAPVKEVMKFKEFMFVMILTIVTRTGGVVLDDGESGQHHIDREMYFCIRVQQNTVHCTVLCCVSRG